MLITISEVCGQFKGYDCKGKQTIKQNYTSVSFLALYPRVVGRPPNHSTHPTSRSSVLSFNYARTITDDSYSRRVDGRKVHKCDVEKEDNYTLTDAREFSSAIFRCRNSVRRGERRSTSKPNRTITGWVFLIIDNSRA